VRSKDVKRQSKKSRDVNSTTKKDKINGAKTRLKSQIPSKKLAHAKTKEEAHVGDLTHDEELYKSLDK
jgi:hypothetical protein